MEEGLRNNLIIPVVIVILVSIVGLFTLLEGSAGKTVTAFGFMALGASLLIMWYKRNCILSK